MPDNNHKILLKIEAMNTGQLEGHTLLDECINDKETLLAALIQEKAIAAAMRSLNDDDSDIYQERLLNVVEDSCAPDKIISFLISTGEPNVISLGLKRFQDEVTKLSDYLLIFNAAGADVVIAESLLKHSKILSNFSNQSLLQKWNETDPDEFYTAQSKLLEFYFKHEELTGLFLRSLYFNKEEETFSNINSDLFEPYLAKLHEQAEKNNKHALYALAQYSNVLYRGTFVFSEDSDGGSLSLAEQPEIHTIALQNYLDLLVKAAQEGSVAAKKELYFNTRNLLDVAYMTLNTRFSKQTSIDFKDFDSVYILLMKLHSNMPSDYVSGKRSKQLFFNDPISESTYLRGIELLGNLMLFHLEKLPGGGKLNRTEIIRSAIPFFDELRKLGDANGTRLFDNLAAELNSLEHNSDARLPVNLTDEDKKRNEHNYYHNGPSNKAYGYSLVKFLESGEQPDLSFNEWRRTNL